MTGYLLRRLVQAVVVLVIVSFIVFGLLQLLPGGPARAVLGNRASPASIANFDRQYGLTRPIVVQYVIWMGHLVRGTLGWSYTANQSVASLIAERLPKTLILTISSVILAIIVGLPMGMVQAVRRNKALDQVSTFVSFAFYSIPSFFLGLVLIILLAVDVHLFPAEGPQGTGFGQVLSQSRALVLPVVTLALGGIALFSRYMRSSVIDNLVEDYVRTARAKGAGRARVLLRHVLRNALAPIATILGLFLPVLLSGAVVVETVFNYPGMGLLFWTAATKRDYPTELGITMLAALLTVVGSLLADIAYAISDPRIRYASR
jgi:peptide/nickel transport system permease protein